MVFNVAHRGGDVEEALEHLLTDNDEEADAKAAMAERAAAIKASLIAAGVLTPELRDAHARLSLLPHINTHPTYRAHVTLAYVHRDREADALAAIRRAFKARDVLVPMRFEPIGLNYGHKP